MIKSIFWGLAFLSFRIFRVSALRVSTLLQRFLEGFLEES